MNTSQGSPQNYYRGDRWSPDWCSNTKIPLFLHLSAPPVANGVGTRSIGNKMLKLTSTHEGLSIGPSKTNPRTEVAKIICFSQKSFLKFHHLERTNCYSKLAEKCEICKFLLFKTFAHLNEFRLRGGDRITLARGGGNDYYGLHPPESGGIPGVQSDY